MGVFTVDDALRAATIDAGHDLGLFDVLDREHALSLAQLAERAGLRPSHRLAALVDALVALGAAVRVGDRIARAANTPPSAQRLAAGWGALADVIRRDAPLAIDDGEVAHRYHRHLCVAGAPAARELARLVVGPDTHRVVDLGGGAGAYSRAVLEAEFGCRVTLVDTAAVIALARVELADHAPRVRFVAADARALDEAAAFDLAIVANVLHLHPPAVCAELCASAARAVAPGGRVAIVDLRRETLEGELFALNMAVYTEGGSVYAGAQIEAWLAAAGLAEITARPLESAPEMMAVVARRPVERG